MLANIRLDYKEIDGKNDSKIVSFVGDLDTTNVNAIVDELLKLVNESGVKNIVGDFEELRYVNSTGIGVLLHFNKIVKDKGGDFILANLNDNVYEIMNIIGATAVLEIYDSLDDALGSLE